MISASRSAHRRARKQAAAARRAETQKRLRRLQGIPSPEKKDDDGGAEKPVGSVGRRSPDKAPLGSGLYSRPTTSYSAISSLRPISRGTTLSTSTSRGVRRKEELMSMLLGRDHDRVLGLRGSSRGSSRGASRGGSRGGPRAASSSMAVGDSVQKRGHRLGRAEYAFVMRQMALKSAAARTAAEEQAELLRTSAVERRLTIGGARLKPRQLPRALEARLTSSKALPHVRRARRGTVTGSRRPSLPEGENNTLCDECGRQPVMLWCADCEQELCARCCDLVHVALPHHSPIALPSVLRRADSAARLLALKREEQTRRADDPAEELAADSVEAEAEKEAGSGAVGSATPHVRHDSAFVLALQPSRLKRLLAAYLEAPRGFSLRERVVFLSAEEQRWKSGVISGAPSRYTPDGVPYYRIDWQEALDDSVLKVSELAPAYLIENREVRDRRILAAGIKPLRRFHQRYLFDHWQGVTMRERRRQSMATRIQAVMRGTLGGSRKARSRAGRRMSRLARVAESADVRALVRVRDVQVRWGAEPDVMRDEDDRVSVDGRHYFDSLQQLADWVELRSRQMEAWQRVQNSAVRRAKLRYVVAKWRVYALLGPFPMYWEGEEIPFPYAEPWHPSLGQSIPALPLMGTERREGGRFEIINFRRFRIFKQYMTGPTDSSNWVIHGRLLMGCFPQGRASLTAGRARRADAAEAILLEGMNVYVNVMMEEELAGHYDLRSELQTRWERLHKQLQQQLRASERAHRKVADILRLEDYGEGERGAVERLEVVRRDAVTKAERELQGFPADIIHIHAPTPAGTIMADEKLEALLMRIEALMREGHSVYLFGADGRGRAATVAACLLGRLYGLPPDEALDRIQRYHDTRADVAHVKVPLPCPSAFDQVHQVRRILAQVQGMYEPWAVHDDSGLRELRLLRRGVSAPDYERRAVGDEED